MDTAVAMVDLVVDMVDIQQVDSVVDTAVLDTVGILLVGSVVDTAAMDTEGLVEDSEGDSVEMAFPPALTLARANLPSPKVMVKSVTRALQPKLSSSRPLSQSKSLSKSRS